MLPFPILHSIFFLLCKYNVLSGGAATILQSLGKKFADEDLWVKDDDMRRKQNESWFLMGIIEPQPA